MEASAQLRRTNAARNPVLVAQTRIRKNVPERPVSRRQAQRAKGLKAQSRMNEAMVNSST